MRVLMLHNDYAETGGEYFSVRAELETLNNRGIEARLVSIDNGAVLATRGRKGVLTESLVPTTARAIVKQAIDEFKPDIIHAQNLFPLMGGGTVDLIREAKLPWVRSLRNYRVRCISGTCFRDGRECTDCSSAATGLPGIRHSCYRGSKAASTIAVGYAIRERRATKSYSPTAYIVLSNSMLAPLAHILGDTPSFVKPNSVAGSKDLQPVTRSDRTDEFLFVGRFSTEKGVADLLTSFALAPELRLTLIGGGSLSSDEARLASSLPNVSVLGELPNVEVQQRMRKALAVLVPSKWAEPFGRVAAEALASATPPLVSNMGGLPDVVGGLAGGRLVIDSADDWTTAARQIRGMAATEFDSLAHDCLARWASNFEMRAVGDQLVDIYESALRSHAKKLEEE